MRLGIYSLRIFLLLPFLLTTNAKLTLLTNSYPPFSDCSHFQASPQSSSVVGAEIELLRTTFSYLNWIEGVDFEFNCINDTSMVVRPDTLDNQHQAFIGGISITSERLQQKQPFSQPTVSSKLDIVYRKEKKGWFFVRSFKTEGWMVTLATVFLIGGILYLLESRKIALINMIYCACCQFFMVPDYPIEHISGKILQISSSFLVMVLVAVFTATASNIFQEERGVGGSLCLAELRNQHVYTNQIFSDYLKHFGVIPIIIDDQDPVKFAHEIYKYGYNYFFLDGPFGNYVASQNCELYTAENHQFTMHYGIMYDEYFPNKMRQEINAALLRAKTQKNWGQLVTEYYSTISNFVPCKNKFEVKEDHVSLYELRGLWYLLGCGVAIAVLFMIYQQVGILVKKNFRVYTLQGIRAKIDRKVQRRMATLFAIHTGVSIQCITFLKKLNQEALQSICQVAVKAMNYKTLRENLESARQEIKPESNATSAELGFEVKGGFSSRATAAISWIRKGSRKRSNLEKLQIPKKRDSNDSSPRTPGNVRSKRSSMLKQTMVNFKLNSELMQKVQALALSSERQSLNNPNPEIDLSINNRLSTSRSAHVSIPVELNKSNSSDKDNHSSGNNTTAGADKKVSVVNKILGKKGIKQNKQMTEAAKALLQKKEAALLEEFKRKENDISTHLKALKNKNRTTRKPQTVEPLSPKSRNGTLYPSTFKLKMLGDQSPSNNSRRKLRLPSSPEPSPLLRSVMSKVYEFSPEEIKQQDQSDSKFKVLLNLQEISEYSGGGSSSDNKRSPEDQSISFFEESPKFRRRAAEQNNNKSFEAENQDEYRGDETPIHIHKNLSPYLFSNKYGPST